MRRDAAAAQAAAEACAAIGSVDSFQRAVLRRYEPLRRETANAMITERARADASLTNSQRWALTGARRPRRAPQQRPLGRWGTVPAESPAAPPPSRPQAPGNGTGASGTDASTSGAEHLHHRRRRIYHRRRRRHDVGTIGHSERGQVSGQANARRDSARGN